MHVSVRRLISSALSTMLLMGNGCAAVSLFDQHHTHHHHYDGNSSAIADRLESLERRMAKLDQPGRAEIEYSSHETTE
ncbi:MAG: hypothetical protein KDA86_21705 [Planctomycetaceae bacterium]|nr:hypothetical protein [Planctomycetaceae bacterium]